MDAVENEAVGAETEGIDPPRPKVVYTHAPIRLGKLQGRADQGWRVTLGGQDEVLEASPDVDTALLDEVAARGGRVLVETVIGEGAIIVGVVQTQRALTIDADGDVDVEVRSFQVKARREVLLSTARSFVKIDRADIELYGEEVVTRARQVAKILGRLISLN